MRRAIVLVVLACWGLGCTDATLPERPAPYRFWITLDSDGNAIEEGGFRAIFRWPREALPVRVWTQPEPNVREGVIHAIGLWRSVALYGEFRAVLVSDSQTADIIITRGEPKTINNGATFDRLECQASTSIGIDLDTAIVLPFRTDISPRTGATGDQVARCFETVLSHELGFALGLFPDFLGGTTFNGPTPEDLMYSPPRVDAPSARDQATFNTLYHTKPTVKLPVGR
jgi:predicted Zn-dependent protease